MHPSICCLKYDNQFMMIGSIIFMLNYIKLTFGWALLNVDLYTSSFEIPISINMFQSVISYLNCGMNRRTWTTAFTKQRFLFAPEDEFASKSEAMATFSIVE